MSSRSTEPTTIPEAVARAAMEWPGKEAVVSPDRRISYSELHSAVQQVSRALIGRGVEKGDRVAVWAPNSIEWIVASLGLRAAGAWLVPINTRYKSDEAETILARSRTRLVFTVGGFLGHDYPAMLRSCDLPDLQEVVLLGDTEGHGATPWSEFMASGDAVGAERATARAGTIRPDDVCDVLFTAGTTGVPKGAMLTHGASIGVMEAWADALGFRHEHRSLGVNPFFHIFGLNAGILVTILRGATLFPQLTFDVDAVLDLIADEQLSFVPGPPTVFQMLLDHPERTKRDISSLEIALVGAASIPPVLVHRIRDDLGFDRIVSAYGLTEATGLLTISRRDDSLDDVANASGSAMTGVTFRVVDDEGREVEPGTPGELTVRTPYVMKGYLDDREGTALAIDDGGFLHTGDVGYFDENGNVHITDRKKDMYIVGGFNVYSAEVEQKLAGYAGVAQVAVVGVPDHRLGTVGMAFVVPASDAEFDSEMFLAWCREHMANFKVPRFVQVVAQLPLSAVGKVLKYQLREEGARLVGPED